MKDFSQQKHDLIEEQGIHSDANSVSAQVVNCPGGLDWFGRCYSDEAEGGLVFVG